MIEFVCFCAVIACVASWLLTLAYKWGVVEWLQIHSPNAFFDKLFSCNFCMSWWVGVALSIIFSICFCNGWLLFCPFVTATITKRIIE